MNIYIPVAHPENYFVDFYLLSNAEGHPGTNRTSTVTPYQVKVQATKAQVKTGSHSFTHNSTVQSSVCMQVLPKTFT